MADVNLGPVVRDGVIRFLSVSQLEKFDVNVDGGCPTKWWFRYVAREKEAQKAAAKLGEQCHAQAEHYLKTGEDVLGPIVRAGMRFLPRPGSDLLVEVHYGVPAWPGPLEAPIVSPLMGGGVPFVGKADLMHVRGEWVDDEGVVHLEPDTAEVVDWKNTKQIDTVYDAETGAIKFRGYAKTAEALARTWQMLGYGELVWQRFGDRVTHVRLGHGYFQTKGPRFASKRSIRLPLADVRAEWRKVDPLVEKMQGVARIKDVRDVEKNYKACGAYGGCAFKDKCPRDPKLMLAELVGRGGAAKLLARVEREQPMSLMQKRLAAKAAAEAAAASGAPATTSAPAPTLTTAAMTADQARAVAGELAALEREEAAIRAGILPHDVPAPSKTYEPLPENKPDGVFGVCKTCSTVLLTNNSSRLPDGTVKHITCKGYPSEAGERLAGSTSITPSSMEKAPEKAPASSAPGAPCAVGGTQVELDMDAIATKKFACSCGFVAKVKPAKLGDNKYYALVPKHDAPGAKAALAEAPKAERLTEEQAVAAKAEVNAKAAEPKASEIAASPQVKAVAALVRGEAAPAGFSLYLDSAEDGVALKRIEPYVDGLCRALEKQYDAADIRCASNDSPLGFGRWRGALAAFARATLPEAGAYACSSGNELSMVVFDALREFAARVVRKAA